MTDRGPKYQFQIEPQLSKIHRDGELDVLSASRHMRVFVVVGSRFSGKSQFCHIAQERFGVLTVRGRTAGSKLFLQLLRARHDARRSGSVELPVVFVDDFAESTDLEPVFPFFLPRPRVLSLDATKTVRLSRARAVESAKWNRHSLRVADDEENAKLRRLESLSAIINKFDTTQGLEAALRELQRVCALKPDGSN